MKNLRQKFRNYFLGDDIRGDYRREREFYSSINIPEIKELIDISEMSKHRELIAILSTKVLPSLIDLTFAADSLFTGNPQHFLYGIVLGEGLRYLLTKDHEKGREINYKLQESIGLSIRRINLIDEQMLFLQEKMKNY